MQFVEVFLRSIVRDMIEHKSGMEGALPCCTISFMMLSTFRCYRKDSYHII